MNAKTVNRRRFLGLTGAALGACALTCAGAAVLLGGGNERKASLPLDFPDTSFGEDTMEKKILVAYASAAGSTGGVAETLGKALAQNGATVDVRPVQSVTDLSLYRAVVLGSAIHGGKWLPEATTFVQDHQQQLAQVPTAFFLVGMMVASRSENKRALVEQFLAAERALVMPVAEGRFVGALFPSQFPYLTRVGMRFFLAYCGLGLGGGDYRDPEAIRAWAASLAPMMGSQA